MFENIIFGTKIWTMVSNEIFGNTQLNENHQFKLTSSVAFIFLNIVTQLISQMSEDDLRQIKVLFPRKFRIIRFDSTKYTLNEVFLVKGDKKVHFHIKNLI